MNVARRGSLQRPLKEQLLCAKTRVTHPAYVISCNPHDNPKVGAIIIPIS